MAFGTFLLVVILAMGVGRAAAEPTSTAVIGDSLVVAAGPYLPSSWFVDAHNGRALVDSVARLGQRPVRSAGCVVVALGSNDVSRRRTVVQEVRSIEAANQALSGHPCVLWPLVKVEQVAYYGPGWRAAAMQWNRVVLAHADGAVLDWAAEALGHPEYFLGDGLHMNHPGRAAYARFLRAGVQAQVAG